MEITKHEIDSEVLGRPILELTGPYRDDFARIESDYLRAHHPFYVVYKAPVEDVATIQHLEENGFRFVETQLRMTFRLRGHFDTSKAPYVFERVTTEDQLRDVLEIAANTFTDDRFLVDPELPDAGKVSSARYQAYVRQSFRRPDERVYRLVNPATRRTIAFKTHRIVNREEALMLLGGVHSDFKNAGVAPINAYHEFNELMRNGVKRFTTHVSARNYAVINLELGGFQYRLKQTFIVLRKIYA
ncbi:MAG TPA: hypothetical protein VMJ10_00240 [Kofleriaceae bacterium]|nr:hypothetical protein [Kofleriaceae bacterium]